MGRQITQRQRNPQNERMDSYVFNRSARLNVSFRSLADIAASNLDIRFTPKSGECDVR
jgi:hypothetical protein